MNYKQFDTKPDQSEEREELILSFLMIKPLTILELTEKTGLLYHQVQSCLIKLRTKKGLVNKKRFQEEIFYGVIESMRNDPNNKDVHKGLFG